MCVPASLATVMTRVMEQMCLTSKNSCKKDIISADCWRMCLGAILLQITVPKKKNNWADNFFPTESAPDTSLQWMQQWLVIRMLLCRTPCMVILGVNLSQYMKLHFVREDVIECPYTSFSNKIEHPVCTLKPTWMINCFQFLWARHVVEFHPYFCIFCKHRLTLLLLTGCFIMMLPRLWHFKFKVICSSKYASQTASLNLWNVPPPFSYNLPQTRPDIYFCFFMISFVKWDLTKFAARKNFILNYILHAYKINTKIKSYFWCTSCEHFRA